MKDYQEILALVLNEVTEALHRVPPESLDSLRAQLRAARRIFVAGKGRSGLHMRAFAMRLMHLGLVVHVVDDVTTPAIGAGDALVVASGSGQTSSLVQYADKARTLQASLILITASSESPMRQQADMVVYIPVSSPKSNPTNSETTLLISAQPLANLFEQCLGLLLDMVVIQLMDELGVNSEQMFARHANLE